MLKKIIIISICIYLMLVVSSEISPTGYSISKTAPNEGNIHQGESQGIHVVDHTDVYIPEWQEEGKQK